jgi:hypothetical protein
MSRQLRAGDRVSATGTVQRIAPTLMDPEIVCGVVAFDGDDYQTGEGTAISVEALTLLTPAEPPVGSVVVKDGVAWVRLSDGWCTYGLAGTFHWSKLADGDVIHVPGGDA